MTAKRKTSFTEELIHTSEAHSYGTYKADMEETADLVALWHLKDMKIAWMIMSYRVGLKETRKEVTSAKISRTKEFNRHHSIQQQFNNYKSEYAA